MTNTAAVAQNLTHLPLPAARAWADRLNAELDAAPVARLEMVESQLDSVGNYEEVAGIAVATGYSQFSAGWLEQSLPVVLVAFLDHQIVVEFNGSAWVAA